MRIMRDTFSLLIATSIVLPIAACERGTSVQAPVNAAENASVAEPAPPSQPVTVDRNALLVAVAQAASAFASGASDTNDQAGLDGRQFSLRLPFACGSGSGDGADDPLRLVDRKDGKSFEVSAKPTITADDIAFGTPAPATGTSDGSEAIPAKLIVEGFWIVRPWMLSDRCPAATADAPPADALTMTADSAAQPGEAERADPAADKLVGIAQYYDETDSRLGHRSGRDYRRVVPLGPQATLPKGMVLVLEGRLRAWPGGKVIQCRQDRPSQRPTCIAGARIDRVAIERADDRTLIGEWTSN